jgi:16S rRNA (adenine1518-N6/adenine1519-N6)-dimethyltransferase
MRQHTKTLGQVFLHDNNIINKIVALAESETATEIIEIGCGKGILTQALNALNKPILIIEIDPRWLDTVKQLNLTNCRYHLGDVLEYDFLQTPKNTAVIANIPYNITTPIIDRLSRYKTQFSAITMMIQKEMADRLYAKAGTKAYGSITIFTQYHFDLHKGFKVSRSCFSPPPNVDSYVLKMTPKTPLLPKKDEPLFFSMVHALFWGRRKTIQNCLKNAPHITCKGPFPEHLSTTLKKRGETLDLDALVALFNALKKIIESNV